ncbi:rhamnogalacturonan lyase [Microbacterium sp. B2969]|uniref:Rhamnogalacturonan lyase n=1 Tax=Microbacterium alkaliflavum TaxID=3248839 RepID=A0ABW7Q4H3_9MICO
MNHGLRPFRALAAVFAAGCLVAGSGYAAAAAPPDHAGPFASEATPDGLPQLEALDRGLVAVSTTQGVFVSWRLLASEATGSTATGIAGPDFVVARDGQPIATVTDSTNYVDAAGTTSSRYTVTPVVDGIAGEASDVAAPSATNYLTVPLRKPADGITPKGEAYTYSANDASVADVDGDGAYELVVKWDPSNSKDVSQVGYTGEVYVDTYELDGTLLSRISLGVNIRAGAHYTQFLAYDFDGDGRSELMMKTAPGTKTTTFNADGSVKTESYVTMPADDLAAGYTNQDDYRMSNADFRAHLVQTFMDWQDRPEVASGEWPATLEQAWGVPVTHQYPLSEADATELTNYFIDVYAPSRSANNRLGNWEGFIVDGPEYLTVFDGLSGAELQTVHYEPPRGDDGLVWGDYALPRIEPANRVDRFLSGVAYLDGTHPSAIFARGYYTRTTMAAYDWDGTQLVKRWFVDSGHVPMTNPFNDTPHGRDGTDPEFATITTQGDHSLSAADVDGDGKHEIVYGSATIDDDGSLLYSSFDTLPPQSAQPGQIARLGHGDAMHVTDIDPNRPGLEIFTVHEGATSAPYGYALRDAATGEVIYGEYSGRDTGRGMIGDIDPTVPGLETWATRLRAADGTALGTSMPGTNMSIRWSGDLTTQIVNGSGNATPTIDDRLRGRLLTATDTRTNNGTKGNPSLVADILGDWREELVVRTTDSSALRIYVSTDVTSHKLVTLMHDIQYRSEIARQQTTYNQPAYTGWYLASDMDFAKVPLLTVDATPREPELRDRPGTGKDEVQVHATDGVAWYVNGERVTAPNGKVRVDGHAEVVAVPTAWYRFPAGATTRWTADFTG